MKVLCLEDLPLLLEDFVRSKDSSNKFNTWSHPKCLVTSLGNSNIKLETCDYGEPDEKMLLMLNQGISVLLKQCDNILNLLYGDYKTCVEQIAEDLDEFYDVGSNTPKSKICNFVYDRCIYVVRNLEDKYTNEKYRSCWYCSPEWEEEHGFYINLANQIERVDC